MIENQTIGDRVRECRRAADLTLKAIEAMAGVSATHISEIERGKTSPTVGALSKIAEALDKDITYFLEREPLEDVCHMTPNTRAESPLNGSGGVFTPLTRRVPGAKLSAYSVILPPGCEGPCTHLDGNKVIYVRSGRLRFTVDDVDYVLDAGDSIHLDTGCTFSYVNDHEEPCELFCFGSTRLSPESSAAPS